MIKSIDQVQYLRYTGLNNAEELVNKLEQPEFIEGISFVKANQAISFLKAHTKDDEFEIEAATSAILKAISYLEQFEKELLEIMIDAIAKDERKKELSKIAHTEAKKIIDTKIVPSFEKLLSDIESLNNVGNYSPTWFTYELKIMQDRVKKAMRV